MPRNSCHFLWVSGNTHHYSMYIAQTHNFYNYSQRKQNICSPRNDTHPNSPSNYLVLSKPDIHISHRTDTSQWCYQQRCRGSTLFCRLSTVEPILHRPDNLDFRRGSTLYCCSMNPDRYRCQEHRLNSYHFYRKFRTNWWSNSDRRYWNLCRPRNILFNISGINLCYRIYCTNLHIYSTHSAPQYF